MKRIALALVLAAVCGAAGAQTKIKYALGDVIGIDDLPLLVAAERAKKRGVEVEVTSFKNEDIATQAVINGQADVGQGTPYAAIEKVNVPVRFDTDYLEVDLAAFTAGAIPKIPLLEIKV